MNRKSKKMIPPGLSGGFTLIEIIIVLGLVMFVYAVAIPNFGMTSSAAIATKLAQFGADVRNAYDLSVLSGKTYRMVIQMNSGDYWLERADRKYVRIGSIELDRDLNPEEEKELQEVFESNFEEYVDLAGTAIVDPETDKEIQPTSPVITARDRLRPPNWTRVDALEWRNRSLGPDLIVMQMQAEHHSGPQNLQDIGEDAVGMIHFFPAGYVERAYLHVYYKKSNMVPDEEEEPYTIVINPNEGTAEITSGLKEVNVDENEDI